MNPVGTSSQIQILSSEYGFLIEQNAWLGTTPLRRVDSVYGEASPVPEASTTVSFGFLLAQDLGAVVVARRRRLTVAAWFVSIFSKMPRLTK